MQDQFTIIRFDLWRQPSHQAPAMPIVPSVNNPPYISFIYGSFSNLKLESLENHVMKSLLMHSSFSAHICIFRPGSGKDYSP